MQDNNEALKKLIPMSDDELIDLTENNLRISAPSIVETTIHPNSPSKTIYGDFSMNSFVFVDKEQQTKEDDNTNVYMDSIIDLYRTLNNKIDIFTKEKSKESIIIGKIYSLMLLNDTKNAMSLLKDLAGDDINTKDLYEGLLYKTIPEKIINIKNWLIEIKDNAYLLKNSYNDIENRYIKKVEESERLKNIVNQQNKDHKAQIDSLANENNNIKDRLIKIHKDYCGENKLNSLLEEDIIKEINELVNIKCNEILNLKQELSKRGDIIGQFERKANMFDVANLNSQVESLKQVQHKLQDENLNLTQISSKLSERNTKLKQELIFFNSELKKAKELVERKNETIARQKSLIELFQEKLGGTSSYPIEDLRKKKIEIEERLEKESDYFIKQRLRKEKEDCSKRLSDFLSLQSNKKV